MDCDRTVIQVLPEQVCPMRLNQVTVPSTDVAKSIEFYKRLGLIQIVDSPPKYARFVSPDGDATFSIHHYNELSPGARSVVYFECENLDDTVSELKSRGVDFDSDPV